MNDFDAARLVYLSILAALVIGAVVVGYRGRWSQAAQHAAIWALIAAGAVIAYGLRDTLREQLFGAPVETLSQNAVQLRRGGDGHFHARIEVNGTEIRVLVDTGATHLVLSRRDAERVGLDPDRLLFTAPARTANGLVYSAPVTLASVRLGPFEDRGVGAMVNGGDLHASLLGMGYLDRFARVTVEGDVMRLER